MSTKQLMPKISQEVWVRVEDGRVFAVGKITNVLEAERKVSVEVCGGESAEAETREVVLDIDNLLYKDPDDTADPGGEGRTHRDNTQLIFLNPGNLFENLVRRYRASHTVDDRRGEIYTYTGWVLTAMNPYQTFEGLYSDEVMDLYYGKSMTAMPPHPFAVAETAYHNMIAERLNQCVIVTGESGAGKTETAKQVMRYLTHVSAARTAKEESTGEKTGSDAQRGRMQVQKRVLATNPILESFGNAKTVRNDNSSRFGKMMKLNFSETGDIQTASIQTYLLAKSRVTQIPEGERNYHVFYALLEGISEEEKEELLLEGHGVSDFLFLRGVGCLSGGAEGGASSSSAAISSSPEGDSSISSGVPWSLEKIKNALTAVGVSPEGQQEIFRVLCAILFLGNVVFSAGSEEEGCSVSAAESNDKESPLKKAAELLGLNCDSEDGIGVLERALTKKKIVGAHANLNVEQAKAARDAFCKTLYSRLFDVVVHFCNEGLQRGEEPEEGLAEEGSTEKEGDSGENGDGKGAGEGDGGAEEGRNADISGSDTVKQVLPLNTQLGQKNDPDTETLEEKVLMAFCWIGILDIFGFENMEPESRNSFEQCCINFCNEQLQQLFFEKLIKREKLTYSQEGIPFEEVEFNDNTALIRGIAGRGGVFEVLDEVARAPMQKGGDRDEIFSKRINKEIAQKEELKPYFGKPKGGRSSKQFIVHHYAGSVQYDSSSFCEKNNDALSNDLEGLFSKCSPSISDCLSASRIHALTEQAGLPPRGAETNSRWSVASPSIQRGSPVPSMLPSPAPSRNVFGLGPAPTRAGPDAEPPDDSLPSATPPRGRSLRPEGSPINPVTPSPAARRFWHTAAAEGSPTASFPSGSPGPFEASPSGQPRQRERGGNAAAQKSLGLKFARQVDSLTKMLSDGSCQFIRCIKPNDEQKAGLLDRGRVYTQLENSGMVSLLHVMKEGFPCRVPYQMLWDMYSDFLPENMRTRMSPPDFVDIILRFLNTPEDDFCLGNTKVFFRFGALAEVEKIRDSKDIEERQRFVDATYQFWLDKRKERIRVRDRTAARFLLWFKKQRAQTLAASAQVYCETVMLPLMKQRASEKIRALWGVWKEMKRRRDAIRQITLLQRWYRSILAARQAKREKAAIRIQTLLRAVKARCIFREMKREALETERAHKATRIQKCWRKKAERLQMARDRKVLWLWTRLQALTRGKAARRGYRKMQKNAIEIAVEQAKRAERERVTAEMEEERERNRLCQKALEEAAAEERRKHDEALRALREEKEAKKREEEEREDADRSKQQETETLKEEVKNLKRESKEQSEAFRLQQEETERERQLAADAIAEKDKEKEKVSQLQAHAAQLQAQLAQLQAQLAVSQGMQNAQTVQPSPFATPQVQILSPCPEILQRSSPVEVQMVQPSPPKGQIPSSPRQMVQPSPPKGQIPSSPRQMVQPSPPRGQIPSSPRQMVQLTLPPPPLTPPEEDLCKVFVSNLSPETSSDRLQSFLSKIGFPPVEVRVCSDGVDRPYARFATREKAEALVTEFHSAALGGRMVTFHLAFHLTPFMTENESTSKGKPQLGVSSGPVQTPQKTGRGSFGSAKGGPGMFVFGNVEGATKEGKGSVFRQTGTEADRRRMWEGISELAKTKGRVRIQVHAGAPSLTRSSLKELFGRARDRGLTKGFSIQEGAGGEEEAYCMVSHAQQGGSSSSSSWASG
uniref:Myosin motor domain-containing protein n=1 Tax=Chromera velia CCMP2878 TaxID=1169474 RepID=A0A0G4GE45_9ALVE|eukprot:Cvel_619.t1-p1 / transcript=Cvel_619.t1 / gene=Cvel_619 / organism=Chromera_velia_CCMP2878 / gene_product=Myosin-13, putative / transcript_product=Myosin-13, putative / location=Cvel_scaffold19:45850-55688(-) / protein_length=1701 / sequence_SO=supercontig / SO=protein_coding / is_pseudo=false